MSFITESKKMLPENALERYLNALLTGDRTNSRAVIEEILKTGMPANAVYLNVIWPIMLEIEHLTKEDRLTPAQEHMATRINRTIVDQLQNKLPRRPAREKKVVICSAESESKELGGQILADLFESDGWEVRFIGGGVTNEDVLAFVNQYAPDVLLIYGTAATQAPQIRSLIDKIKSINAWPDMKIMLSGGLFDRAEGLWQEIGADLFAPDPQQTVQIASGEKQMEVSEQRSIKQKKRNPKKPAVRHRVEVEQTNEVTV